jgi:chemotaxis family two-component system sensor histidine kinase/response regulator PixL
MNHKGTVLIVEDEPELRTVLGQLIEMCDYRVISATNGKEALEQLKKDSSPKAILLDMMMPIMNGDTFLREIRNQANLSEIPVIQMSAALLKKHKYACCVIDKPFEIGELIHLLETCPRIVARANLAHS